MPRCFRECWGTFDSLHALRAVSSTRRDEVHLPSIITQTPNETKFSTHLHCRCSSFCWDTQIYTTDRWSRTRTTSHPRLALCRMVRLSPIVALFGRRILRRLPMSCGWEKGPTRRRNKATPLALASRIYSEAGVGHVATGEWRHADPCCNSGCGFSKSSC